MSEISIVENSLIVRLDGEHDLTRAKKFLAKKGFRLRNSAWKSNNTSPQKIISIQNYFA